MPITLTYFDGRGRAEIVRMTLAQCGLEYTDNRVNFDDWKELKMSGKSPFKQLPIVEVDGTTLAQSKAIAKYFAREHGLYGKNNFENSQVDMVCDALEDVFTITARAAFESDEARKAEMKKKASEETVPNTLTGLERILKANQGGDGFFVGNEVTLADIHFYCVAEMVANALSSDLSKYPKLSALNKRVAALPKIAAWLEKRPASKF